MASITLPVQRLWTPTMRSLSFHHYDQHHHSHKRYIDVETKGLWNAITSSFRASDMDSIATLKDVKVRRVLLLLCEYTPKGLKRIRPEKIRSSIL